MSEYQPMTADELAAVQAEAEGSAWRAETDTFPEGMSPDTVLRLLATLAERDRRIAALEQQTVSNAAKRLSALGAVKGGHARAEKLSRQQRSEIASKAACARWDKRDAALDSSQPEQAK
jgi:hypothetical protein